MSKETADDGPILWKRFKLEDYAKADSRDKPWHPLAIP